MLADQVVARLQKEPLDFRGLPPDELRQRIQLGEQIVIADLRDGRGWVIGTLVSAASSSITRMA